MIKANTLVAIGDEEGGVRLVETAKDDTSTFSKTYLAFRPHENAILDLSFSPDDLLLATASGDQTAQIIDMPTQRNIYTLAGHVSSVKQARFQPGSSSVIATSSRDGTVRIWDLRCKGVVCPVQNIKTSLDPPSRESNTRFPDDHKIIWARSVNVISDAHAGRQVFSTNLATKLKSIAASETIPKTEHLGRQGDISVTALSFLPSGREHLILTASEARASVKLWDLRRTQKSRRNPATPLSTTRPPESHTKYRQFGINSIALSSNGGRLYTLCRDNTIYAYATSHLILGHAPEFLSSVAPPRRPAAVEKEGLGPVYGFRHPQFHATTFYVKSALRPGANDKSELLAVGSSDTCVVLFPTDERYMKRTPLRPDEVLPDSLSSSPSSQQSLLPNTEGSSSLADRLNDTIPIYQHGSALVRGHSREVTGLTWTPDGDLVSVADDFTARCWREGENGEARDLRVGGEGEGRRWGCGWAESEQRWDADDR